MKPPSENDRFVFGVRNLPVVEAPESVWNSIEAALDRPPRRAMIPGFLRYAAALIVVIIVIGAVGYWYSTQPPKPRWEVERLDGSPSVGASHLNGTGSIAVGEWLQTDGTSRARIKVGDIGTVEVEPNTRLRLAAAKPNEHRLTLARGDISATVSAPPRLFFVDTSSSTAVDLGCAYTMHADDAGTGLLRVTLGWVSLEWEGRESMVPAGAQCRTRPKIGPGTPYFEDASEKLQQALASFDFEKAARHVGHDTRGISRARYAHALAPALAGGCQRTAARVRPHGRVDPASRWRPAGEGANARSGNIETVAGRIGVEMVKNG